MSRAKAGRRVGDFSHSARCTGARPAATVGPSPPPCHRPLLAHTSPPRLSHESRGKAIPRPHCVKRLWWAVFCGGATRNLRPPPISMITMHVLVRSSLGSRCSTRTVTHTDTHDGVGVRGGTPRGPRVQDIGHWRKSVQAGVRVWLPGLLPRPKPQSVGMTQSVVTLIDIGGHARGVACITDRARRATDSEVEMRRTSLVLAGGLGGGRPV